jgi:hypothetical protein
MKFLRLTALGPVKAPLNAYSVRHVGRESCSRVRYPVRYPRLSAKYSGMVDG